MRAFPGIALTLLALLGLTLGVIGISFLSYEGYRYFAPRYTAVDSAVFHESAQYNDGMIRSLVTAQLQYEEADETQKKAIRALILHQFSVYPEDRMPAGSRAFYEKLKGSL